MTHDPLCREYAPIYGVVCICTVIRKAYRRGFNDHATSRAIGAEMYGVRANQHGEGENP